MITVTKRTLDLRTGSEGAPHDPTATRSTSSTRTATRSWRILASFAGSNFTPRGAIRPQLVLRDDEEHISGVFRLLTGIALRDFVRYYERTHPYDGFEDPMGPPSRYI